MKTFPSAGGALLALVAAIGQPALAVDFERGRELHYQQCRSCHDKEMYLRSDLIVKNYQDLRDQVDFWQNSAGFNWQEADIEDVTFYLNEIYFKFDCPHQRPGVC